MLASILGSTASMAAGMAFTDEHVGLIAAVGAGVGSVVGILTVLDRRWKSMLDEHAEEEQRLDAIRHEQLLAEMRAMLAEHLTDKD